MSFIRVRTIKGKKYRYEETRWREGGKVRSRSVCLGAIGADEPVGWFRAQLGENHGIDWDAIGKQMVDRQQAEDAKQAAFAARVYLDFGMKVGTGQPVEVHKPETLLDLSAPMAAEENTPPNGEADVSETPDQ
jgi:hypothetical protein